MTTEAKPQDSKPLIPGHPVHAPQPAPVAPAPAPPAATSPTGNGAASVAPARPTGPSPAAAAVPPKGPPPPPPPKAGLSNIPAPGNRFLVCAEKGMVRVRGLPLGRLTATEARALAAHLCLAADDVALADDQDFADLFSALQSERDAANK